MEKISSRDTFFFKKIFPGIWFGFLGLFILISLFGIPSNGKSAIPFFLIVPILMAIFGYLIMKNLVFDLADEVWDDGSYLLIKNKGEEDRIDYKNIKNISYTIMTSPNRVTISLRIPCKFGSEVTFSSPSSWIPLKSNKRISELIDRIDKARNG